MKNGLFSILFLVVMLCGMAAMVAGQEDSVVVSDSVVVTDPGPVTVDDLLLLIIPAALGFISKVVVDMGTRYPKLPNPLVALGAILVVCALVWLLSLVLPFNAVYVMLGVITGYFGGSVKGTYFKK